MVRSARDRQGGESVAKSDCPAAAAGASLPLSLAAQTVKVGLINSYTGFAAQPADQGQKGFDLYTKEHAKELPPGVKIELLRATTPPIRKSASGWRRS